MKFPSILFARCKTKLVVFIAAGACLAQVFSGCDQNLRNQLLSGINASLVGLVTTFINAFFQSLTAQPQTSQPVVQAILEMLPKVA